MDNLFNRIIKYVSKLLLNHSQIQDNKKLLREIVFILDEVEDIKASLQDCLKVKLNPIFKEMFTVLDYCKLFLSNSTVLSYKNDFDVFAFLIPMEYIFEDFVFGFIKKEMPELKVKSQEGTTYLTTDGIFKLKPDLVFNIKDRKVIADTKYKCAYYDDNDKKKGILEADMYQMLAYAIRNKVTEIKLLFPSTVRDKQNKPIEFIIQDEFAEKTEVKINAYKLPIIAPNWQTMKLDMSLSEEFEESKELLIREFQLIFEYGASKNN
jgi:5-methylcytosine-specific restriction enzyme subunit McrC